MKKKSHSQLAYRVSGTLNELVRFLFQHRHRWADTRTNAYMIAVEQRCEKCGEYRHHMFCDLERLLEEPTWHPGKHPNRDWRKTNPKCTGQEPHNAT